MTMEAELILMPRTCFLITNETESSSVQDHVVGRPDATTNGCQVLCRSEADYSTSALSGVTPDLQTGMLGSTICTWLLFSCVLLLCRGLFVHKYGKARATRPIP